MEVDDAAALVWMIAILNPFQRRGELAGDWPAGIVAAGAGLAAAVFAIAAVAGSNLLSALDISEPNALIAAGLLALVMAVLNLFWGANEEGEVRFSSAAGPRSVANLVFPVLGRPEVFVAAMALGAAGALAATVAGALVGCLLFAALTTVRTGTLMPPAARAVAALGVVAGVDMIVDGVLAV